MIYSIPVFNNAAIAIQRNIRDLNNTAGRIANSPVDGELPDDVLKLKITKNAVSANIAVVKASQETRKNIVDILV